MRPDFRVGSAMEAGGEAGAVTCSTITFLRAGGRAGSPRARYTKSNQFKKKWQTRDDQKEAEEEDHK
jgi:hypothetical protein